MNWTEERLEELETLRQLLNECQQIDSANNVIGRLARIVQMAERLNRTDYERRHTSLMQFLWALAIDNQKQEKP